MLDFSDAEAVAGRLQVMLSNHKLPKDAEVKATKLLQRLISPIRICIMGFPGSGKSAVLNFFAGAEVVPVGSSAPTLELTLGDHTRTTVTLPDGETRCLDGMPGREALAMDPLFLSVEARLDVLREYSLLELVADEDPEEFLPAVRWAKRRTDIVLWCTRRFTDEEAEIWSGVPERMKDNSFLLLTHADQLESAGSLRASLDTLHDIAGPEFYKILPIAAADAAETRWSGGPGTKGTLDNSGGAEVLNAVNDLVVEGRRADVDSALVMLGRFEGEVLAAEPVAQPVAPVVAVPTVTTHTEEAPAVVHPVEEVPQVSEAEAEPPAEIEEQATDLSKADVELLSNVVARLSGLGAELGQSNEGQAMAPSEIVNTCGAVVDELAEQVQERAGVTPALTDLADGLQEAAEILVLMQLEADQPPVGDAVVLALQLRRDVEIALAA